MRSLGFLNLDLTSVTDISPVAGLTNLIQIQVGDGDVSDLTPLANLINLETLWSQRNRVTDITPILGLTGLRILNLYQVAGADCLRSRDWYADRSRIR
jgi:internalin A